MLSDTGHRSLGCTSAYTSVPRLKRVRRHSCKGAATTTCTGVRLEYGLASECASHPKPHGRIVSLYIQRCRPRLTAFFTSSDAHDLVYPAVPHLTHSSPYTPLVFTLSVVTLLALIPLVNLLPLRTTFLILGLAPFLLTHPFSRYTVLPLLLEATARHFVTVRVRWMQLVDNDRLEDKHWYSELRAVELWENERWSNLGADDGTAVDAGWNKSNLRPGERKPWTRGRDGWSGVTDDGSGDVRSVQFPLFLQASVRDSTTPPGPFLRSDLVVT